MPCFLFHPSLGDCALCSWGAINTLRVGVVGPRGSERVGGFVGSKRWDLGAHQIGNLLTTSMKGDKQWCPGLLGER